MSFIAKMTSCLWPGEAQRRLEARKAAAEAAQQREIEKIRKGLSLTFADKVKGWTTYGYGAERVICWLRQYVQDNRGHQEATGWFKGYIETIAHARSAAIFTREWSALVSRKEEIGEVPSAEDIQASKNGNLSALGQEQREKLFQEVAEGFVRQVIPDHCLEYRRARGLAVSPKELSRRCQAAFEAETDGSSMSMGESVDTQEVKEAT